jgi:hypothetical protein
VRILMPERIALRDQLRGEFRVLVTRIFLPGIPTATNICPLPKELVKGKITASGS